METSHPLDAARASVAEIVDQSPAILDVIVLASVVSHCVEEFQYLPRVAFLSDAMRTGKTTAQNVAGALSASPFRVTLATTDPAVVSAFNTPTRPTILVEETSTIFGKDGKGRKKPMLQLVILDGVACNATAGHSRGGTTETFSTFCIAFLAGRGAGLPDDGRDRSIICPMRRSDRVMRPYGDPETVGILDSHNRRLRSWAQISRRAIRVAARELPDDIHPELTSRRRDVWTSLFAVAEVAGGVWPARCLAAFRELALGNADMDRLAPRDRIRVEAANYIRGASNLPARVNGSTILRSSTLLDHLRTLNVPLFENARDRSLQTLITDALGASTPLTPADGVNVRGWDAASVVELAESVEAELAQLAEAREDIPVTEDF